MSIQSTVNRHPAAVAIALFLNFVIFAVVASYVLADNFKKIEKNNSYENLHGVGKLKIGQIQAYLHERKGRAGRLKIPEQSFSPAVARKPVRQYPRHSAASAGSCDRRLSIWRSVAA